MTMNRITTRLFRYCFPILVAGLLLQALSVLHAFQITTPLQHDFIKYNNRQHHNVFVLQQPLRVIKAEETDFGFDVGSGGVRLASESIIKVKGIVKYKPGQADPAIKELVRYKSLTLIPDETTMKAMLQKSSGTIVCIGNGKELYKDPGTGSDATVIMAPSEAVKDAFIGAGSVIHAGTIVINFAGGDDVQVLEILDATKQMVLMLDTPTKVKIVFHSISSPTLPQGTATVTVVAFPEDVTTTGGLSGIEKAIASGEIYKWDGKYWTLEESSINTAVA